MLARPRGRWLIAALSALCLFTPQSRAEADEPWLVDVEASAGMPITEPQRDWFGVGGTLALGVQKPLASWVAVSARLRTGLFLDGDPPKVAGVRDPGLGTLNVATLGVALRLPDASVRRGTGLWVEANGGGGFTGKELRPSLDLGAGYGFPLGERTALSPLVRFVQVFQPNDELSASDARLGLIGVRLSFLDAVPPKAAVVEAPPPDLPDRDRDGILDMNDRCIDVPEDADGFEDGDGCPESDNDQDGILDANDGCPSIAEDKDGFQDEDGCPDDDNDHDGVLDTDDHCPSEPETLNGEQDQDGCPDQGLIVMEDDRIVLEERVLFDVLRARVKSSATPVLAAIVRLWKQHPEWMKVRIEGHADVRGDAAFNQQLSERRAANVREALTKLGMNPEVVIAEGFGATRLLTTGTTEEDHRKNRRVEFVVIARFGDVGQPDAPPSPELGEVGTPTSEVPSQEAPAEAAPAAEPAAAPAEPQPKTPEEAKP